MQLLGVHHLTAVTANARGNLDFYTGNLGLRLVKKTVNQDDVSAYHLFYADGKGTPGTDITFFDWPAARERRGTRSISRTAFRVSDEATLNWWQKRFAQLGVKNSNMENLDNRPTIEFEDPEGQRLALVVDERHGNQQPWEKSPIPPKHQIRGLGPITLSISNYVATERLLSTVLNMRHAREYSQGGRAVHVFEMGAGGAAAELHVRVEPDLEMARLGAGGVHHVAFRTPSIDEYDAWFERLNQMNIRSSGPIDRFYFRSLYFREPNGILLEIATDGPGFATDEPLDQLGEHLALPPFLESRRHEIEAGLKPI
ncbi:MAG: glyoxalase family protein [Verrucomicrobiota bacterium]